MKTNEIYARFSFGSGDDKNNKGKGKIKRLADFKAHEDHNFRKVDVPNADKERSHLNEELIKMKTPTMQEGFKKMVKASDYYKEHKVRKNAVLGVPVHLGMGINWDSKEKLKVPDDLDVNEWKRANVEWLKKTFGEENILSAVLHMDEKTPHIHAIIIPMDERGCLNARDIIGGPQGCRDLQDEYEKAMEPFGFKKRVHRARAQENHINRWYSELEEATIEQVPEIEQGETQEMYRNRLDEMFQNAKLVAMREREALKKQIEDLKNQNELINQDLSEHLFELEHLHKAFGETMERNERNRKKILFYDELAVGMSVFPDEDKVRQMIDDIKEIKEYGRNHIENLDMTEHDIETTQYTSGVERELISDIELGEIISDR